MDPIAKTPNAVIAAGDQAGDLADAAGEPVATVTPDPRRNGRPTIPTELAVLPIRGAIVFPGTVVPLTVGREKSKRLLDDVLASNKLIGVFTQRRNDVEDPSINDVYRVGTASTILKMLRMPDGTTSLLVHGLVRVGLEEMVAQEPYWRAKVNAHEDETTESLELRALAHTARTTAIKVLELSPNVPEEAKVVLASIEDASPLSDFLAANLSLGVELKQELLETFDVADRLRKVSATLNDQLEILQLSQKIQTDVRSQIDKSQRDYYLQEQMKAIQRELGEADPRMREIEELRTRISAAQMPEVVQKEAGRELERLQRLPQASPETGVIRDYLDWLIAMPWSVSTTDNLDLNRARKILDDEHYGLQKIKRRIIEYLAVRKLKPHGRAPILCFLGPPGVGKTSLGRSIAHALERKFIRISLGGVRDEADLRGHRRTYIGASPGRIVTEMRKIGARNPLIVLDELDKMGADFRGDPSAALLEILDPKQNDSFTDHYLGVPFDLSGVLFIATCNYMDGVAPALRDRMEVIELPSYTMLEKLEIAKRHLIPDQLDENGLPSTVAFSDEAIRAISESYTSEAGVRNLNRTIGAVCRGVAAKVASDQALDMHITIDDLHEYLGPPKYLREFALAGPVPGVVTGLAYTPVGGEIIFVEITMMPGRGSFNLTGQIGDVMRESAQIALSLVRSKSAAWRIPMSKLHETDVHIHVPAGGIPKDGPSAGVAMLTALVSGFTHRPVPPSLGMTGEITLRGEVLPVGGVREKLLAAHRAGLKTVILPARNEPDLEEIPAEVLRDLKIIFAKSAEDVLTQAFGRPSGKTKRRPEKPRSTGTKKPAAPKSAARTARSGQPRGGARAARGRGSGAVHDR